jgi:hypothetical protein
MSRVMPLHQLIQRALLLGVRLHLPPAPPAPQAPVALRPLIEAIGPAHREFDARAVHFGHRYRSGFWAIYLLSAIAVLCAVLPLALGWDSPQHALHSYAGLWALAEVTVIGTVSAIYWLGSRRDWQGEWLRARTTAELSWYLPMVAPLLDLTAASNESNWYLRVFDPGQHVRSADDIAALCAHNEALARTLLDNAWSQPAFIASYARWTCDILAQQHHYHHRVAIRQHALVHRVHRVNSVLFGLTALGAFTHLLIHTLWLSLVTTFFPALGASLHGALAQSEAYRLSSSSERLSEDLQDAIGRIRAALAADGTASDVMALRASIESALALILEEHQDWNLLVRPHNLPLA